MVCVTSQITLIFLASTGIESQTDRLQLKHLVLPDQKLAQRTGEWQFGVTRNGDGLAKRIKNHVFINAPLGGAKAGQRRDRAHDKMVA